MFVFPRRDDKGNVAIAEGEKMYGEYSYERVEAVLERVFEVKPKKRSALRARIKHLRRLGLSKAYPGKGKRIIYTVIDAFQWALALEIGEFGADPIEIVKLLQLDIWPLIAEEIEKNGSVQDEYLVFYPNLHFIPFYDRLVDRERPTFLVRDVQRLSEELARPDLRRVAVIRIGLLWRQIVPAIEGQGPSRCSDFDDQMTALKINSGSRSARFGILKQRP